MDGFLKSPKTRALISILCIAIALLFVFGLGILVGYRRALFAVRCGGSDCINFSDDPFAGLLGGMMGRPPFNAHGVAGEVVDLSSSSLSVRDPSGNDQSVLVFMDTPIRDMDEDISFAAVKVGDEVTVIGEPDMQGEIEARLIRVFPASAPVPTPPSAAAGMSPPPFATGTGQ